MDIIEVIDDGIDAFAHDTSNHAAHDTGGRRWVGPVAAAALVAVIGYGVATSASSSDAPRTAVVSATNASIAPPGAANDPRRDDPVLRR